MDQPTPVSANRGPGSMACKEPLFNLLGMVAGSRSTPRMAAALEHIGM